jgi:hypothetical protein
MKSTKSELYKISFDQNDIDRMVHIEHLKTGECETFFYLEHVVSYVIELQKNGSMSKKEAINFIIKEAADWLI